MCLEEAKTQKIEIEFYQSNIEGEIVTKIQETLNNFDKSCSVDVFFALSHGVHRGKLKSGKEDDRIIFLQKLFS